MSRGDRFEGVPKDHPTRFVDGEGRPRVRVFAVFSEHPLHEPKRFYWLHENVSDDPGAPRWIDVPDGPEGGSGAEAKRRLQRWARANGTLSDF